MIYFFDTCAIARYYCDDLGSYVLRDVVPEGSKIAISYLSIPETVSALRQTVRDTKLSQFTESEYNDIRNKFLIEVKEKFVVLTLTNEILDYGAQLADELGTGGADSVILSTAIKLIQSLIGRYPNEEMIFVTSDKRLYNASYELANKYEYFKVLHFWTCKCNHCGEVCISNKYKKITCPNCNKIICEECHPYKCLKNIDKTYTNVNRYAILNKCGT